MIPEFFRKDRIRVGEKGNLFWFEWKLSAFRKKRERVLEKIRKARLDVLRETADEVLAFLKTRTPQKYRQKMARSWSFRIRSHPVLDVDKALFSNATIRTRDSLFLRVLQSGTPPHIIRPKKAIALWWPGALHPVALVRHPGFKGSRFLIEARELAIRSMRDRMREKIK